MSNEKEEWKPEAGKTAWVRLFSEIRMAEIIENGPHGGFLCQLSDRRLVFGNGSLFPTPGAALASIKVYDLQGNEMVPPPCRSVSEVIEEYKKSPEYADRRKKEKRPTPREVIDSLRRKNWEAIENPVIPDHTHLLHHFVGVCSECGKSIELDPPTTDAMTKLATTAYSMDLSYKPEREGDGC